MKEILKKNKGQVAIEYMLMIAAVAAIVTSIMGVVKKKYLGDMTKCITPVQQKTVLCRLSKAVGNFGTSDTGKRFQFFPFKK